MIKKYIIMLVVMLGCFIPLTVYAALPTPITNDMLIYSVPEGATKITIPRFELNKRNQVFSVESQYSTYSFIDLDGRGNGCYQIKKKDGVTRLNPYFMNGNNLTVKPNRNYLLSALVWCDFDKTDCEVYMGMYIWGKSENGETDSKVTLIDIFHGLPPDTNGQWYRFETILTTPEDASVCRVFGQYSGFADETDGVFYLGDIDLYELPEATLTPLNEGEGLTFGGSSGMFNMKVSDVKENGDLITISTNGSEHVFDKANDTITISQKIGLERELAVLTLNKPLENLELKSRTDNEAILTTGADGVSFGVQMDGMLIMSTQGSDLEVNVESQMGGFWNRLRDGNLICMDDVGGFSVNPAIPLGTGRLARYTAGDGVDFERPLGDTTFISSANPGWSVKWTISSGERLGVSPFPSREYDWEGSFDSLYANVYTTNQSNVYSTYRNNEKVKSVVLWDFTERSWGMSYSATHTVKDEEFFKEHINAAKSWDIEPTEYMSMYFYDRTLEEYLSEVKRHRDEYGITGVYTDGLPPLDWLKAYEGVRKLREIFPDGTLIAHTTGQNANGGPPLATPELYIPNIDSYMTYTLRGESVPGDTIDWKYPRFITTAYGASNTFGIMKSDGWFNNGESFDGDTKNSIYLLYNGRTRHGSGSRADYFAKLEKLEKNWKINGSDSNYYEKCYLPNIRRLARQTITDYPTETLVENTFDTDAQWKGENNGGVVGGSELKLTAGTDARFDFLTSYGKTDISFGFKTDDKAQWKIDINNAKGDKVISIAGLGNRVEYLNHRGGYTNCNTELPADSKNTITISADPVEGRFSLSINGETVLTNEGFYRYSSDLGSIKVINDFGTGEISFDNLTVQSGI